jgi:hypothetical protein
MKCIINACTNLYTEITSVNIVSQKEISGVGWIATNFKELHEVVVLPMNISTYSDWRVHLQKVGFRL